MLAILLLPLIFAKNLEKFKHVSFIGVFSISFFTCLTIYNFSREYEKNGNKFNPGNFYY